MRARISVCIHTWMRGCSTDRCVTCCLADGNSILAKHLEHTCSNGTCRVSELGMLLAMHSHLALLLIENKKASTGLR